MSDQAPTQPDSSGVTRTSTGEIANLDTTFTPPSEKPAETIVRPAPTPTPTTTPSIEPKTEAKADGKAPAAAEPKTPRSLINEEDSPQGAPEKYEDFKVPEGFALDTEAATEFNALAKAGNLSQSYSQKLVDFYIKLQQQMNNAPAEFYETKQNEWKSAINSDPEIGGSKWNGTRASIGRLFDSLGDAKMTDAFREAMDYTGAGNHPAVVKFLARVAARLTEGGPVRGGGPSQEGMIRPGEGRPSAAQAIYPNLPSNRG